LQPAVIRRIASNRCVDASTLLLSVNLGWSSTRCELESHPIEYGLIVGPIDAVCSAVSNVTLRKDKLPMKNCSPRDVADTFGKCGIPWEWNRLGLLVDPQSSEIQGHMDLGIMKLADPYEYLSAVTNSICVVTKQAYSVGVYYDGKLGIQYIFNRKSGLVEERELDQLVLLLGSEHAASGIGRVLLDVALRISEMRKGALIVLGDIPLSCLSNDAAANISGFLPKKVLELPRTELINYAIEDYATWVDQRGLLRGHNLSLIGPGGRHSIAKDVTSKNEHALALVVSQDGEITLFRQGLGQRLATQTGDDALFDQNTSNV